MTENAQDCDRLEPLSSWRHDYIDRLFPFYCETPSSLSLLTDSDLFTDDDPACVALAEVFVSPFFPHPLTRICLYMNSQLMVNIEQNLADGPSVRLSSRSSYHNVHMGKA